MWVKLERCFFYNFLKNYFTFVNFSAIGLKWFVCWENILTCQCKVQI